MFNLYDIVNIAIYNCDLQIVSAQTHKARMMTKELITQSPPKKDRFKTVLDGSDVSLYRIKNRKGVEVSVTNYGARIVSFLVPDSNGKIDDIVLGYNSIEDYLNSDNGYYGATIGRFGNRISNGTFTLNNETYQLQKNELDNHLHGGERGLHTVVWDVSSQTDKYITLKYRSEDGEGGYPGNMDLEVIFSLNDSGELTIRYKAVSDKKTIINLTNHAFFNLAGAGSGSVANHMITINADSYTPVDGAMIPTGEIEPVADGVMDFREMKPMGRDWNLDDPQLNIADGYDHNFVLRKRNKHSPEFAARVSEANSGRMLELETTEPALQFYTANALNGQDVGREGIPYEAKTAFCLETQNFPDSPNKPHFPSATLEPGELFTSTTIYRISW